jgi:DNA-binding LytR/AlgR family response regulator
MRVLIVDDEPLAQTALANVLAARVDVEHFDSANDAVEAIEKLATESYDVLLLDINMPELSGTELADQLRGRNPPLPSIVFVTAHDEYAIAAFEKHAVDYVLKPFSNERIGEALDRAVQRAQGERASKLIEALPQLQKLARPQYSRIAIKSKGRILFINPGDVVGIVSAAGIDFGCRGEAQALRVYSNPSLGAGECLVRRRDQTVCNGGIRFAGERRKGIHGDAHLQEES